MRKPTVGLYFDAARQEVTLNGQAVSLQDKASRVLTMIVSRSPDIVSRAELIGKIWSGNHLVGERGLNQALWSIRSALGDDARNPVYIKTLPREGYQCLKMTAPTRRDWRVVSAMSLAASICVAAIALTAMTPVSLEDRDFTLPAQCAINSKSDVQAYRVRGDVFVDIENGCRLIATPDGEKTFGDPMVSDDGKYVAFTVTEDFACRFIAVDLEGGKRTEFDQC